MHSVMPKLDISKELKFDHYEISCNMSESNAPFPYKLFALLLYESGSIIRWIPHGRAFLINDVDEFVMKVMPKYFKQSKLTSFQRQLNLYGFRRLTRGDDTGAYFHPNFRRDRHDLISSITRLPGKGSNPPVDYSEYIDCISTRSVHQTGEVKSVLASNVPIPFPSYKGKQDEYYLYKSVNLDPPKVVYDISRRKRKAEDINSMMMAPAYISGPVVPRTKSKLTMNIGFEKLMETHPLLQYSGVSQTQHENVPVPTYYDTSYPKGMLAPWQIPSFDQLSQNFSLFPQNELSTSQVDTTDQFDKTYNQKQFQLAMDVPEWQFDDINNFSPIKDQTKA